MRLAKRILDVQPSATLAITSKGKALKAEGKDVVILAAGEPDFDTPEVIKEAAIKAIKDGFTKYTPSGGIPSLKAAICRKFNDENGLIYKPEEIVVSCGAKHSLYNIFQVICEPGDEVLIIHPYWVSYPEMVKLAGGIPKYINTKRENGFKVTPEDIEGAITDKTIAIVINSPSNPAGIVYGKDDLEKIAEICIKKGVTVISDEIYEHIIFDGDKHVSIASLSEESFKNTIVVNGVSKSFSMTGWRIGYIGANKDIIKQIVTLQSHSTSNPASISQKAAECAITTDMSNVLKQNCAIFQKRRDLLTDLLADVPGVAPFKTQGAFYMFCDISKSGIGSMDFAGKLIEEKYVVVIPGGPFGEDTAIRVSFAASEETIKEGVARIKDWL